MKLRDAGSADADALAAIYGHHVLTGLGTFEEVPPPPAEMAGRLEASRRLGLPYLVAVGDDGAVAGFAYASPFRTRTAYRFVAEDSVYVAPGRTGQGIGAALLGEVIRHCEDLGLRQLIAMIGDSGNVPSIGLHRSLGFEIMGTMPAVGFKHGRWLDVVCMQRALNGGSATPPPPEGLVFSPP